MKFVTLLTLSILTSTFAMAATLELSDIQSDEMMTLIKSSGAESALDGRTDTVEANNVTCLLERSLGVSCVWTIKKTNAKKATVQELNQKSADALYDLLNSSGLSPELDGRTAEFKASKIICTEERMLGTSCVVIE